MTNPQQDSSYFDRLTQSIQSTADNGDIVIKWVAVVEVMDKDGDRGIYSFSNEESLPWDVLGLHEYALASLRTQIDMSAWHRLRMLELDEDEDEFDDE